MEMSADLSNVIKEGQGVSSRALRNAAGRFVTGVTVVTTTAEDGQPRGFTANSFASVSLEPPLILVCVGRHVGSHALFEQTSSFAVSVLSADQIGISSLFASKRGDKFEQIEWSPSAMLGNPLPAGAAAWLDCDVHQRLTLGDHLVLIGLVREVGFDDQPTLAYADGRYAATVPLPDPADQRA